MGRFIKRWVDERGRFGWRKGSFWVAKGPLWEAKRGSFAGQGVRMGWMRAAVGALPYPTMGYGRAAMVGATYREDMQNGREADGDI